MTVRELIFSSLRLIGVLAAGETPSNQETTDAFNALNIMLDSYSAQNLMIPAIVPETFTVVAGQQSYSMGPLGNFNTTRPTRIVDAQTVVLGSNPRQTLPLKVINIDQFSNIFVKSVQSTIPLWLYNDNAFPSVNLNLWPVPQVNSQIDIWSQKNLAQFATLNDLVALAPSGNRMLKYNLAVEIAPEYGKNDLDSKIIAIADGSMMAYKRAINQNKPYYMGTDDVLIGPKGSFNWLTGDTV
jgi:hypothetical protein